MTNKDEPGQEPVERLNDYSREASELRAAVTKTGLAQRWRAKRSTSLSQTRGELTLLLDREPEIQMTGRNEAVGIDAQVRLFLKGDEVPIDGHRRIFFLPQWKWDDSSDAEDKWTDDPEAIFWSELWDSVRWRPAPENWRKPNSTVDTFNSSTTWPAPSGVTSVDAEAIGGGGGGGNGGGAVGGAGGGGGGAYSEKLGVSVTPSNNYTVTVGTGGSATQAGGDSWFKSTGDVLAKGGSGGGTRTGGQASAGVGDTKFSGGDGALGQGANGGGGGGAAGATGDGGDSTTATGGTGNAPGGNGGNNSTNGTAPGGGGGGGNQFFDGGGSGAAGRVILTYTDLVLVNVSGNQPAATGTVSAIRVTSLSGNQPAAAGALSLIKYFVALAGNQPAATGAVQGALLANVAGNQPAATGALTWQLVASLSGNQPAATGALTAINYFVALTGNQPAATGALAVAYLVALSGNQPAAAGALSLIKYLISLAGNQPASTGLLFVHLVPRILTARAYLHNPFWPRERTAELLTAADIDRAFERMKASRASLTIARTEPQLSRDVLYEGAILVIESIDLPPWAGTISRVVEDLSSGRIDIEAVELTELLNAKVVPLQATFNTASGLAVASMLSAANARADSGIRLAASLETGLPVIDYAPGAQTLLSALNQLHDRTGFEWWVEPVVRPSGVDAFLHWGDQQGEDVADDMHLYEGVHFSVLEYQLAVAGVRQAVQVIGGVESLRSRQSVIRAAAGVPSLGGRKDAASQGYQRTFSERPAALFTEAVILDPLTTDPTALARTARRELERPRGAAEGLSIVVNRRVDWRQLRVGNYITVTASSLGLGEVTRVVRIVGLQPDEDAGECEVEVEVPL